MFWKFLPSLEEHHVPYHDDYTNFETDFERDKVRNEVFVHYTRMQKEELLNKAIKHNERIYQLEQLVRPYYDQYIQDGTICFYTIPEELSNNEYRVTIKALGNTSSDGDIFDSATTYINFDKLATPTNMVLSGSSENVLTWNNVQNAKYYKIVYKYKTTTFNIASAFSNSAKGNIKPWVVGSNLLNSAKFYQDRNIFTSSLIKKDYTLTQPIYALNSGTAEARAILSFSVENLDEQIAIQIAPVILTEQTEVTAISLGKGITIKKGFYGIEKNLYMQII